MNNKTIEIMPNCLFQRAITFVIIAVGFAIIAIICSIALSDTRNLVILLGSAYTLGAAIHLIYQWNTGKILALPAYCLAVEETKYSQVTKSMTVIFSVNDDETPTRTFTLSKNNCKYIKGLAYVIYVSKSDQNHILASEVVA